jgi:hypothetical protein
MQALFLAIALFLANMAIFVAAYNCLATPHILEEQRAINARHIIFVVLPAFASVSVIFGALTYWLASNINTSQK